MAIPSSLTPPAVARVRALAPPHRNPGPSRLVEVSVCIVNWNCCDYLRACLRSILDGRQGVALEVIVVDNGSRDGAADMVEEEFPEVVLIRNASNRGFARANNQAARVARGRYLFFLNNDTVVPRGALRALADYAALHPKVGMIGPRLRDGHGEVQASCRLRPTLGTFLHRTTLLRWTHLLRAAYQRYRRQEGVGKATRQAEMLLGAAVFLPRKVFETCGGWDEDFTFGGEDLELSARVGRSHEVVYLPRVEITHFGRVSTRQHLDYAIPNIFCGFALYLRKTGCSRLSLLAYKLVLTLDAPVQMVHRGAQYLWRRMTNKKERAEKSLLTLKGLGYFLWRGLIPFWRA
jgi:GT2 family glycosyltransferase